MVTHRSALRQIVVDVAGSDDEHAQELEFWQAATGVTLNRSRRFPEYHGAELPTASMGLLVQRLGDGPSRVHLDIHADDMDAEVKRLERLGAEVVERRERWTVMRDPAGLPFCVVVDTTLDDSNARVWEP